MNIVEIVAKFHIDVCLYGPKYIGSNGYGLVGLSRQCRRSLCGKRSSIVSHSNRTKLLDGSWSSLVNHSINPIDVHVDTPTCEETV